MEALRAHLTATTTSAGASAPEAKLDVMPQGGLPKWVSELRRFLAEGDIAAQQLWTRHGDELKAVLPVQTYLQVRRALENFEFDAALEALAAYPVRE